MRSYAITPTRIFVRVAEIFFNAFGRFSFEKPGSSSGGFRPGGSGDAVGGSERRGGKKGRGEREGRGGRAPWYWDFYNGGW